MSVKSAVLDRYSQGAQTVEPSLCCPVSYDPELTAMLPQEILDKDYGCGDPSRYVQEGDTVLDLGSGGGKICYMAAQLTGPAGRVIGIDMNDDMLALARKYQHEMTGRLGGSRIEFRKGHIQDLALDLETMEQWLADNPVNTVSDYDSLQQWLARQRQETPMIADNSIDLVISNCVLNLVHDNDKQQLINEIHRVLKPGGRIAIADIVSDEPSPPHLKSNPELWSGCISGAFDELSFVRAFLDAGFIAVKLDKWDEQPWQTVEGIEYRSVTITAIKGDPDPCLDSGHAVIYKGPFAEIRDDEGHVFPRGERMAVCARTFRFLTEGPLQENFIGITPARPGQPVPWCAPPGTRRTVQETKGGQHRGSETGSCC